jgi:hypothetical protein
MESNWCSGSLPEGLVPLAEVVDGLAAQDLDGLPDAALAEQTLGLRRLVHCLEGQWLRRLAAIDGRGAAGAEQGIPAASTASWLRNRLRLGAGAAHSAVRTARALFRGPSPRPPRRCATASCRPPTPAPLPMAPTTCPPTHRGRGRADPGGGGPPPRPTPAATGRRPPAAGD